MSMRGVTPGYFRALRVRVSRGRFIEDQDGTRAMPVVVINDAAADRFFAGKDPLGQQLAFWGRQWTIVGVVGNEKFHGVSAAAPIAAYMPLAQAPARGGQSLLVRASGEPRALASAVRAAFAEVDPALAIFGVEPLESTLSESLGNERFLTVLLLVFAAVALVLAAIGIHGVLSYAVAQRTRELGIRMALGASPRNVLGLVLGQSAKLTLTGLAIGLTLGGLFARALAGLLFGVTPADTTTFVVVPVILGLVAALATWLPARRAASVDPLVALRQ
jgi:predicted permease